MGPRVGGLAVDGTEWVTQSRTLSRAEQQVRDLIETWTERSTDGDTVTIEVVGVGPRVASVRRATAKAAREQAAAARQARALADELRAQGM